MRVGTKGKKVTYANAKEPRTSRDPDIMSGALVFAGTRLPVKNLFDYLEAGEILGEFLDDFPTVVKDMAIAVMTAALKKQTIH